MTAGAAVGCFTAAGAAGGATGALNGGGVDVRAGTNNVSSLAQTAQTLVPRALNVSHIPQTTPISRNSFCNVSSRSWAACF